MIRELHGDLLHHTAELTCGKIAGDEILRNEPIWRQVIKRYIVTLRASRCFFDQSEPEVYKAGSIRFESVANSPCLWALASSELVGLNPSSQKLEAPKLEDRKFMPGHRFYAWKKNMGDGFESIMDRALLFFSANTMAPLSHTEHRLAYDYFCAFTGFQKLLWMWGGLTHKHSIEDIGDNSSP